MNHLDPITANIDECLGLNKYAVDETHAHITLTDDPDPSEFGKLVRVCPAGLYKFGLAVSRICVFVGGGTRDHPAESDVEA